MNYLKKKLKPLTSGFNNQAATTTSGNQQQRGHHNKDLEDDLYDEYVVEAPPHPSELLALGVEPSEIDINDPDKLRELYRKAKEEGKDKKTNSVLLARARQKEEIEEKKRTREEWKFFDSLTSRVEQVVKESQKNLDHWKESSAVSELTEPDYELRQTADEVFRSVTAAKLEKGANDWIDFDEDSGTSSKKKDQNNNKDNSTTNQEEGGDFDEFGCPKRRASSSVNESQNIVVKELLEDFGIDLRTAKQREALEKRQRQEEEEREKERKKLEAAAAAAAQLANSQPANKLDATTTKIVARPRPRPKNSKEEPERQESSSSSNPAKPLELDPFDTSFVAAKTPELEQVVAAETIPTDTNNTKTTKSEQTTDRKPEQAKQQTMNRHQSNPFLSDWDDDLASMHTQTNAHLFDTATTATIPASGNNNNNTDMAANNAQQPRRSSCGQAEFSSNTNSSSRPSLYRRNMSSFEAASLQLEQHQQQMLENGSSAIDTQKDLIAKMTADFQSAIQTNDKQFENLSFNPFDPFETIVDDDGLNSPAPTSLTSDNRGQSNFDMEPIGADPIGGELDKAKMSEDGQKSQHQQQQQQPYDKTKGAHDSIDDDEDELVSTPVRNIKSSGNTDHQHQQRPASAAEDQHHHPADHADDDSADGLVETTATDSAAGSDMEPNDSITKASMFAALLASAESGGQQQQSQQQQQQQQQQHQQDATSSAAPMNDDGMIAYEGGQDVEATAHVIKGSPNSMGDGNDRSVSFFDPFETVIDKDALTSLVSDSHQHSQQQQQQQQQEPDTPTTPKSNQLNPDGTAELQHQRVAESASIETVIENQSSLNPINGYETTSRAEQPVEDTAASSSNNKRECDTSNQQLQHEEASNSNNNSNSGPDSSVHEQSASAATGPNSRGDFQYDSTAALGRPQGRKLEPLSGIAPPQPTPAKKSHAVRVQRKKGSFQEDSSDSSEEDDRIQIVIRARETEKPDGETRAQPVVVPLLPPPPSKSSMKQARERGQVEDMPSPIMSYKSRQRQGDSDDDDDDGEDRVDGDKPQSRGLVKPTLADESGGADAARATTTTKTRKPTAKKDDDEPETEEGADDDDDDDADDTGGQFVIPMTHSDDEGDAYGKCDTPLYDDDTSYVLEEYPAKFEGAGWEMMLRYPPKKKLTTNRFWKKIFVKLAQVPLAPERSATKAMQTQQHNETSGSAGAGGTNEPAALCWALQIYDHQDDKKPMQEIPIQATYTVSEISSQLFDQFGKIFTIKLQYIFYKERVGVRQGQLARFIHTGHIGSSTTSGGHGVDPISIGAIKRMGAPIEHSPQISQIIKLGCVNYEDIKQFKESLEDCLFRMPIHRDRALTTYKTEEVQMAVRDEAYIEVNQIGTITKQLARVRLFFLSFLNGMPIVEVGINDIHRQGREVVGRMDILPVVTEEWIRLEAWELHSTVGKEEFENPDSRIIKLTPPDATFFELMRFRIRPPRNRELPLQISANMSVTRTRVSINCEVMVPGCVSRKHGQIPCENIAIRVHIPECWVYFFREEKHFRMGSKKSVNRRPGKVKGIERFLGGGGLQNDFNDESSLIEVTSGQAKYEHHHHSVVWRAARWPKETQSAYVQNTMKIRLPLTAYDKMPESFYEFVHAEFTMPATTVSHTTLRSISVNPYEDEPPEKYVKYAAKYEYKVKMRLSVNLGGRSCQESGAAEVSPIVIMKQADVQDDLQREEDSDDDDDDDDDEDDGAVNGGVVNEVGRDGGAKKSGQHDGHHHDANRVEKS